MIRQLEFKLANLFKKKHCIVTGSGTTAISIILSALKPKGRVFIPSNTCETALNACIYAGVNVCFCDICPETGVLDYKLLPDDLSKEDVVLATHIYGNLMSIDSNICSSAFILEDSAQGYFGKFSNGRVASSCGDASILSFGKGKLIDCGNGGAVLTDDQRLAEGCREVLGCFSSLEEERISAVNSFSLAYYELLQKEISSPEYLTELNRIKVEHKNGYLFQMNESVAECISENLDNIDKIVGKRKAIVKVLHEKLSESENVTPVYDNLNDLVAWRYSFTHPDKKQVLKKLQKSGIVASSLFPPLHKLYNLPDEMFENACNLANNIININLDTLSVDDIEKFADNIRSIVDDY